MTLVELLDHMGDDMAVVDAARVSLDKRSDMYTPEENEKLIKYLARHKHWTPFAQVTLKFRMHMPIFVARQYFKHTVGLVRNEVSRRYVKDAVSIWRPEVWREQSASIKQGSAGPLPMEIQKDCDRMYIESVSLAEQTYRSLISKGVCAEQARAVLPQSMMTQFIETGSLAAYHRIYQLRSDPHAQVEIQEYAKLIGEFAEQVAPLSWKYLNMGKP